METMMLAGMISSPVGLIICALIPAMTIFLARGPQFPVLRLVAGYAGGLIALAIPVTVYFYIPRSEAEFVWHIPRSRYWAEIVHYIGSNFIVVAFFSVVGISWVGIPILIRLSRSGRATAPWLALSSVAVSTVVAVLSSLPSLGEQFFNCLWTLVVSHLIVTTGFALAARLPWAFQTAWDKSFGSV